MAWMVRQAHHERSSLLTFVLKISHKLCLLLSLPVTILCLKSLLGHQRHNVSGEMLH